MLARNTLSPNPITVASIIFGALAAPLTAYVRAFGAALGQAQGFRGPMAKQHCMAVMTLACVVASVEHSAWESNCAPHVAAWALRSGHSQLAFLARAQRSHTP